jgi:outer membrane biosynthesis protein TonB
MSAAMHVPVHAFALPWDRGRDDARRLRRWMGVCLLLTLGGGIVIPLLPLPETPREVLETLPPQLARIRLERPEPTVPPPPPAPVAQEQPAPEPAVPKPAAETKPQPAPEERPRPQPRPAVADAREKAAVSGLLAFQDALSDMRETVDVARLKDTAAIQRGSGEAASLDRAVLTSARAERSAGVNVAALSRETGGVALSGRETTRVEVPEGTEGRGGAQADRQGDPRGDSADGIARQRSIEEIRRIFDSNKGALFAIYNRALRADPTLQGKVVLELVISPSGRVEDVTVTASELADENLLAKILNRVRLFDFGQREVGVTTISYPVHFLPT